MTSATEGRISPGDPTVNHVTPVPWPQFAAEAISLYAPPMRRPATQRKLRQVLDEFSAHCDSSSDLTPAAIAAWMAATSHRRGPRTQLALLRTIRPLCVYGESRGYLSDPFRFRKPRAWLSAASLETPDRAFPRHRSASEIRSVLELADQEAREGRWEARRLRAAVYCWCFTGSRKQEILGLRTADIDLGQRVLSIQPNPRRPLKTSSSAARLPIPGPLADVLSDWLPHCESDWLFPHRFRSGPWLYGPNGAKAIDQVKALGRRAGVEGLTILSFRHSFGTHAEAWGIGELMLQRLLRHAHPQTQRSYRHRDLDQLRLAAELIRY
jgi:integrase